ncbi:MAG TPA: ATP-binding protein [Vicinamibacteria bacterium]|nr:ATP-binding protein [Vicinamibacteria bacterium]
MSDPDCLHARECPISKSPCPGECVFAEVMQSVNLGIVLFDTEEGKVLFVNGEAAQLLAGVCPSIDYQALHEKLLAGAPEPSGREPWAAPPLRVEGRLLGYSVYRIPRFVWLFVRDITEKARLEAVAEAAEVMNNIGYVFASVRHEIGNPVNSIKTALSVLRNNIERFPQESVTEYLDRSLAEITRLEELLASLKSFSMYEEYSLQEVDVAAFLRKIAALVFPDFRKQGILTTLVVPADLGPARLDPRALHQVLLNLLTNAADAVSGRPRREVRLHAFPMRGSVAIQVEDSGCGMSDAEQRNLFKPFASTKPTGTGLGLVIAKKMLARMAGTIEIRSRPQVGTLVTITLPATPSLRAGPPREERPWSRSPSSSR